MSIAPASPTREDELAASLAALSDSPIAQEARAYAETLATRREQRRRAAKAAAPLGAALTLLLVVSGTVGLRHQTSAAAEPTIYASRTGQIRTLLLEDGSTLTLDTASRVAVRMEAGARRLSLIEGRAAFDVAHDANRPFSVTAGNMTVTALGTRFSVTALPSDTAVTLVRGRVRVAAVRAGEVTLTPGQSTELRKDKSLAPPHATVSGDALAWQKGELDFRNVPVAAALEQANRYFGVKIALSDPHIGQRRIDGLFRAGDSRALIATLCSYFDLKVISRRENLVTLG
ncbi:FecR family protein [Sphingomonas jatrophae]|uniref:FecR family protein n=1 Tax=Sphingomonas jatrophae TaxID=1166337 RepID=A0A1I6M0T5_9SPHN|nr:FecR domain-containing protein [Sphingomonas jatrophae]SFS09102.1 FecR family protein [Sphingomonas jatrophae]